MTTETTRSAATAAGPAQAARVVHTVIDSPYGPLTLVATDGVLSGLYMHEQRHRPPEESFGAPDPGPFTETVRQLTAYFDGELTAFDVPFTLRGTPFQRQVWERLLRIPYGETRSYGELAEELGKPGASRAVGLANGKNPISIIVPCHRVIGSTGSLTGYGGGLSRKQRLLAFEGAPAAGGGTVTDALW
ncbi:methylated-DNA--[protein]-cysteine S-methyltransferase [Streptomyces sp. NPDC127033]|uniref:methylated-DNA--[protein]-cysteine S-methyltransferase n=1 Tax=Streptomyces sp. NPDC127033 TaxID=3347110 RepID=UPI00365570DE